MENISVKGNIVSAHGNNTRAQTNNGIIIGKVIEKINIPFKSYKGFIPVTGYVLMDRENRISTILGRDIIKCWADDTCDEVKFSLMQVANALYDFNNIERGVRNGHEIKTVTPMDREGVTNAILHIIEAIGCLDKEYLKKNAHQFAISI